ncbi:DUF937 domain-containing protein [Deinococcus depolymerans]|uniref:DUF937 domain-containing protein n=1 Tax=Deinococcus depolymerans TaxID=392408 RepID=A0ABP3M6E3_9DEIO
MNITDLIQSFFGSEGAARLGQAAGLDPSSAQRALGIGLPLQLDALADHAATPEGPAQIAEAIENLPRFDSVQDALNAPDGAQNLQQAGELLGSVLLGSRSGGVAQAVAGQAGVPAGQAQQLMGMALPLLLSVLGQRGVNAGNLSSVLGGLKGGLGGLLGAGAGAALGGAVHAVTPPTPGGNPVPAPTVSPVGAPSMDGPALGAPALSPEGTLDFLKEQFGGETAERIGGAAGFTGSAARRATQAALPLVLNALVQKGRTEAGATDLLNLSRPFETLTTGDGHLNTGVLNDAAETARVEGQGRGLLGGLFGNVEQLSGRLGTALGGSGASAGRLLALLTPMVLAVLGRRARNGNLGAAGLSGLLGGMGGSLAGLLPAGLSSLGALLGAGGAAGVAAATGPGAVRASVPPVAPAAPAPPVTPERERRGGFPWWIIPLLLLLLLGGCWLVNRQSADTAGPAPVTDGTASILVTNPSSDANLPPQPFTMSGTGPAGETLTIQDEGQEVGTATVDGNGKWSAELPAPTVGEHTYTVNSGPVRSEFKVNVAGEAPADAGTTGTASTGTAATPAAFGISAPTADQKLPAGGFTMNGTGKPGEELELFEDGTSLGKITVGEDGTWTFDVPSPTAGAHTYSVKGPDGAELGQVSASIAAAAAGASAANCTKNYTLSITDGQTVSEPFRFGGVGKGTGYSVTVKRGARTIGTKDIPLDATCGWSYQSKPGAGTISYEVRPLGDAAAAPLSKVTLTVKK